MASLSENDKSDIRQYGATSTVLDWGGPFWQHPACWTCMNCLNAPKILDGFECIHYILCEECLQKVSKCPECGAAKRDKN